MKMGTVTNQNSGNGKKLIGTALAAILLMGSTGYLYYDNNQVKELNEKQSLEISALGEIKSKFEKEIQRINNELEGYRNQNEKLQALVSSAKTEADLKEKKIRDLIRQNSSISRLKKEVKNFRTINERNLEQIRSLEAALAGMATEKDSLLSENMQLKQQLEALEGKTKILENRVEIGSALQTEQITVTAERISKGRAVKSRIKKADRLIVSFDLAENKVAEPGKRIIYVRLTDSNGNLIQNSNSDSFLNKDKNTSIPYTVMKEINFSNKKQKVSVPVETGTQAFQKGTYRVEIYCDGNFCGSGSANLK
jgi:hypothetical protein